MSMRDIDRIALILAAAESGTLSDVKVFAILAAVRAEATLAERERHVKRLQARARQHLVRGERAVAVVLDEAASGLEITPPRGLDA